MPEVIAMAFLVGIAIAAVMIAYDLGGIHGLHGIELLQREQSKYLDLLLADCRALLAENKALRAILSGTTEDGGGNRVQAAAEEPPT